MSNWFTLGYTVFLISNKHTLCHCAIPCGGANVPHVRQVQHTAHLAAVRSTNAPLFIEN